MEMLCFSVVPPIGWKEIQLSPSEREPQITQAGRRLREGIPNWQSVYPSFVVVHRKAERTAGIPFETP